MEDKQTNIANISEKVNDLAVLRAEITMLEEEYEAEMQKCIRLQELQKQIDTKKVEKELLQIDMIKVMKDASVKSWKTNVANISIANRTSVVVSDWYKKEVQTRIELGEEVPGFNLKQTEYISIRSAK